jgi:hypothetical protein
MLKTEVFLLVWLYSRGVHCIDQILLSVITTAAFVFQTVVLHIAVAKTTVPKTLSSAQKSYSKQGKRPLSMQTTISKDKKGSYHDTANPGFQKMPVTRPGSRGYLHTRGYSKRKSQS